MKKNDKNPAAYKFQGECYGHLKKHGQQLIAYERSFNLNKDQTDLVAEVVQLLRSNKIPDITSEKKAYWYDLAKSHNLIDTCVLDFSSLTNDAIQSEVQSEFQEVSLENDLDQNNECWLQMNSCLTQQHTLFVSLIHEPSHEINQAHLFKFDQLLNQLASVSPCFELASMVLQNFQGQLCLHMVSLAFKHETEQSLGTNWHETTKLVLPLLLLACNIRPIMNGNQENVSTYKEWVDLIQVESNFRRFQAACILESCISKIAYNNLHKIFPEKCSPWSSKEHILNQIRSTVADSNWRKNVSR